MHDILRLAKSKTAVNLCSTDAVKLVDRLAFLSANF